MVPVDLAGFHTNRRLMLIERYFLKLLRPLIHKQIIGYSFKALELRPREVKKKKSSAEMKLKEKSTREALRNV